MTPAIAPVSVLEEVESAAMDSVSRASNEILTMFFTMMDVLEMVVWLFVLLLMLVLLLLLLLPPPPVLVFAVQESAGPGQLPPLCVQQKGLLLQGEEEDEAPDESPAQHCP